MKRAPNDLNDPEKRVAYVRNHIEWFLKNHPDAVEEFINDVESKYASKLAVAEVWELAALREKAILAKKTLSLHGLLELRILAQIQAVRPLIIAKVFLMQN